MGFINFIKGVLNSLTDKGRLKRIFNAEIITGGEMEQAQTLWHEIIKGRPSWHGKDDVESINFAVFLCSDIAKKICLDIDINVTGSPRADYLQECINGFKGVLRDKVQDACSYGGIMLKPNGSPDPAGCIDYVTDFYVTKSNANGDILGCIFVDKFAEDDTYYTRLEYHRFENGKYRISNKAFRSKNHDELGIETELTSVAKWADIAPESPPIENIDKPLFAYFKMPYNNTIDSRSPLGVSVFHNAIKELKDLDIAWSRKSGEIEDSKHITFLPQSAIQFANQRKKTLPRFIMGADIGGVTDDNVHEHTATLLTEQRIADINSILSMISTKCGFSQGQFVLDRKTGAVTATQIESDDRETIETIKEMRDSLKTAVDGLIYALSKYADLYNLASVGEYETTYSFGDLTYNYEEDRARHWQYVTSGKYPLWRYFVKFEGMSEDEAKEIAEEARNENTSKGLFD